MKKLTLKYAKEQLGPVIPALIIGMIVFSAPKFVYDSYKSYKEYFFGFSEMAEE